MKLPAGLMLIIGSLLVLAAALLGLGALRDQPDSYEELTWRARLVAVNRRHPRLRGSQLACLAMAAVLYIVVGIMQFG